MFIQVRHFVAVASAGAALFFSGRAIADPVYNVTGTANKYISMGHVYAGLSDVTVEAWVKVGTIPASGFYYAIAGGGYLDSTIGFGLLISNNGNVSFQARNPSTSASMPYTFDNQWRHLAGTYKSVTKELTLYINGEKVAQQVAEIDFSAVDRIFGLGARVNKNNSWDFPLKGRLAEVRLWDYARPGQHIRAAMNRRLDGGDVGLIGYWPMNEGSGSTVYDKIVNGAKHNGTIASGTGSWVADDTDLSAAIPAARGFVDLLPLVVTNAVTGSARFFNSGELGVASLTVPDGYNEWQLTESGDVAAISVDAWDDLETLPSLFSFDEPPADTNLVLCLWVTNTAQSVKLGRAMSDTLIYTRERPTATLIPAYSRALVPGYDAITLIDDIADTIDGGSSGGTAIPLHSLELRLISGPAENTTPGSEALTVSAIGDYRVEVIAVNAAGNVTTSAVCVVTVAPFTGGEFVWTGAADSDWHNPANWDMLAVPPSGSDVTINPGASVTLSASSAELRSFAITNATLTFTNWTTVLRATEVNIRDKAVVTHFNCFTNGAPYNTNRVHIVCSNLTVAAGAAINADYLGFMGAPANDNSQDSWGEGPGGGYQHCGGSHGGVGAIYHGIGKQGAIRPVYGSASTPELPGSGGGGRYNRPGRHGGGAILIEAGGHVSIDGTITANGQSWASLYMGAGSGGAILIRCRTFGSNGGIIRANGGMFGVPSNSPDFGAASGGGGRIAIHYDTAAQALFNVGAGTPVVRLSARSGWGNIARGGSGTVWLSDTGFYPGVATVLDGAALVYDGLTELTMAALACSNGVLELPQGCIVNITGDLSLGNDGGVVAHGQLNVGGNARFAANSYGESRIHGSAGSGLAIGGDCVVTNGHTLTLYADSIDGYPQASGLPMAVGGTLTAAASSTLKLFSHATSGGSPHISATRIDVLNGGKIDASEAGFAGGVFAGVNLSNTYGKGPGRGHGSAGAGYGGTGASGGQGSGTPGGTYGDPFAPLEPGSGGGWYRNIDSVGGYGGGLVRLVADIVTVAGTVSANGQNPLSPNGAGSGGAVYITCRRFEGGGVLRARGGDNRTGSSYGGAGGGGRIAVASVRNLFNGTADVGGGTGRNSVTAAAGTAHMVDLPAAGTVLLLR